MDEFTLTKPQDWGTGVGSTPRSQAELDAAAAAAGAWGGGLHPVTSPGGHGCPWHRLVAWLLGRPSLAHAAAAVNGTAAAGA